jgi:hypothetical protein
VTGLIGGTFLGGAAIVSLAVADVPAGALAAGAAFGMLGLAAAWTRWRSRSHGMRLPPPPRKLRAAVARPRWTTGELVALGGAASVKELLDATEARPEGKFR